MTQPKEHEPCKTDQDGIHQAWQSYVVIANIRDAAPIYHEFRMAMFLRVFPTLKQDLSHSYANQS